MDSANANRNSKYERVMSRVHNQSRTNLKSSSFVTRHEKPSSARVGAKPSTSNVSSGVYSELPTFLNDYVPESSRETVKRTYVVKPRKTIKSLDVTVAASPPRTAYTKRKELFHKYSNIRVQESAPSVLVSNGEKWSATHLKECFSSRSHSRLKDLKDEIKAYKETDKLIRLRSSLYKKCGVVLNDVGNLAEDKGVQAHITDDAVNDTGQVEIRRLKWLTLILREELADKAAKNYTVCEIHFDPKFILPGSKRKRLKLNAMPSLCLPDVQSLHLKIVDIGTQTEDTTSSNLFDANTQTEQTDFDEAASKSIQIFDSVGCVKRIKLEEELKIEIDPPETDADDTAEEIQRDEEIKTFHQLCDKFLTKELANLAKAQSMSLISTTDVDVSVIKTETLDNETNTTWYFSNGSWDTN